MTPRTHPSPRPHIREIPVTRLAGRAVGAAVVAVVLVVVVVLGSLVPAPGFGDGGIGAGVALAQTPGTTDTTVAENPAVPAGAGQAPANTPQPTGQPLPSKRQRVADSLVAAFILAVLVGGIAVGWYLRRRGERPRSPGVAES